jgi:hypothetical protein
MKTKFLQNLILSAIALFCISSLAPSVLKADSSSVHTTDVVIITQPSDVVECVGSLDQYLFVVAAPLDRQYSVVYRWWKDGHPITDWVEDFGQITFDTLEFGMSGVYQAEMFAFDPNYEEDEDDDDGGTSIPEDYTYEDARVSDIIFSEPANLYVLQHPEFMKPIADVYTKLGNNLSLTFDANIYGEHNMVDPTYWTKIQWFKDNTPLEEGERYQGTQASILSIVGVEASDIASGYKVRLIGNCDTVWSNSFAINEEPMASITTQPISAEGCQNSTVQLTVEASSTYANVPLHYQWMVNGTPMVDEAGKINGAMTPNLDITLSSDLNYDGTEQFTCHVWPAGYPNNGVVSAPATITWKFAPAITMDLSAAYSAKTDESITFYVTASGDALSYTWTKDGSDLGVDNDTLTIDSLTMDDAGVYVVTVSNDCGEATSTVATLTVTQGPIVVTGVDVQSGYGLHQNFPNPFSVNSTISLNAERSGNANVTVSDMLGNTVATLFNGFVNAGQLKTIQLNVNDLHLSTGTYYVTFTMGDKVQTKQITVVR